LACSAKTKKMQYIVHLSSICMAPAGMHDACLLLAHHLGKCNMLCNMFSNMLCNMLHMLHGCRTPEGHSTDNIQTLLFCSH
jgi:hypothetical protein